MLESKIIDALLKIIKNQQINPSLKEKVERFITRNLQNGRQRKIHKEANKDRTL